MGQKKKCRARWLADAVSDLGPAALYVYPWDADALSGLLFETDRVHLRAVANWSMIAGIAMGGEMPREVFAAMAETPEQAETEYQRYLARVALEQRRANTGGAHG